MDQPNAHKPSNKRSGMKQFFVGVMSALLLAGLGYPLWLYTVDTMSERIAQKISVQLRAAAKRVEQSQTTTQPSPRPLTQTLSPSQQSAALYEQDSHDFSQLYQTLLREESARANEETQAHDETTADEEPSTPPKSPQPSTSQSASQQSLLDLYLRGAGSPIAPSEDLLLQQLLQDSSLGM